MMIGGDQMSFQALTLMQGHLAERSAFCAKVIDRDGKVVGINRRGLDMLGIESEEVCGKVWLDFWQGDAAIKAQDALAAAFAGRPSVFSADVCSVGTHTVWEIEILPLELENDEVRSVLALSVDLSRRAEQARSGLLESLNETLHAMANIATVSQASARMLPRATDEQIISEIASELSQAARRAQDAISELRGALSGGSLAQTER